MAESGEYTRASGPKVAGRGAGPASKGKADLSDFLANSPLRFKNYGIGPEQVHAVPLADGGRDG